VTSPSRIPVAELRAQATAYRRAAKIAQAINVRGALIEIADRFAAIRLTGGYPVRRGWTSPVRKRASFGLRVVPYA
jgi:hypothetical protein